MKVLRLNQPCFIHIHFQLWIYSFNNAWMLFHLHTLLGTFFHQQPFTITSQEEISGVKKIRRNFGADKDWIPQVFLQIHVDLQWRNEISLLGNYLPLLSLQLPGPHHTTEESYSWDGSFWIHLLPLPHLSPSSACSGFYYSWSMPGTLLPQGLCKTLPLLGILSPRWLLSSHS